MLLQDNSKTYESFGRFITEARKRKGLYQREVAAKIGITQAYYHCIEKGTRKLSLPMAINICSVLGLDLNDFLVTLMKKKPKIIRPKEEEEEEY